MTDTIIAELNKHLEEYSKGFNTTGANEYLLCEDERYVEPVESFIEYLKDQIKK